MSKHRSIERNSPLRWVKSYNHNCSIKCKTIVDTSLGEFTAFVIVVIITYWFPNVICYLKGHSWIVSILLKCFFEHLYQSRWLSRWKTCFFKENWHFNLIVRCPKIVFLWTFRVIILSNPLETFLWYIDHLIIWGRR